MVAKEVTLKLSIVELAKAKKPLKQRSNSVDSAEVIHVLPYLTAVERIAFVNELWRVMKKGARAQIVTPYWASNRTYSDLRVQWPPISEGWYFNLDSDYRKNDVNGDKRYKCDFNATWGYALHPSLHTRNQEYQQHAITFWKESAQDLIATLIKK